MILPMQNLGSITYWRLETTFHFVGGSWLGIYQPQSHPSGGIGKTQ